jgi:putative transposase
LEQLEEEIGLPHYIRCDNGLEFTSKVFIQWCHNKTIEIKHTQPGKPMQNGFIERFNRFYREDILDAYFFKDLQQLRILSENWRVDYNLNHPHNSLRKK